MDPGRQIHLSNNNENFWSKMIFEQPKSMKVSEKKQQFLEKNLGKTKFGEKNFELKNFF